MTDKEIEAERRRRLEEMMDWLRENGARHLHTQNFGLRGDTLAMYEFAGRTLIVQTYARGQGWEFYAPIQGEKTWEATRAALSALRP